MLNISHHKLNKSVDLTSFEAGKKVFFRENNKRFNAFLKVFAVAIVLILFLPWTQNISSQGNVTTLKPSQRPQTIQSPIPGRIEKWYVQEGDFVNEGDTILHISEVKNEYFDPKLIQRTQDQINSKTNAVSSYENKVKALSNQIVALKKEFELKLEQAQNKRLQADFKVDSDSIYVEAAQTNLKIAESRYNRIVSLNAEGLKSVKDVEEMKLKLQETQAQLIASKNSLLASRNEVINASIELNRIRASYADKISKAESDRFSAETNQFDSEVQVSKLENSFSNYQLRSEMRYIRAPQSGYINRALKAGVGETFKEGEALVGIMPYAIQIAVETFIDPIDLPLIHINESVRLQFDGWPAIVFSGWPNASHGTFGGKVVAIENFISTNGKYRILISPDEEEYPWPEALRVGSGARSFALLNDVPIWYELWRKLNGFPPNYYQPNQKLTSDAKK